MIKKFTGILFFAAAMVVIVAVMVRHGSFRSMMSRERLPQRRGAEKTAVAAPAPAIRTVEESPANAPGLTPEETAAAAADSPTSAAAAPGPSTAPDGSIR